MGEASGYPASDDGAFAPSAVTPVPGVTVALDVPSGDMDIGLKFGCDHDQIIVSGRKRESGISEARDLHGRRYLVGSRSARPDLIHQIDGSLHSAYWPPGGSSPSQRRAGREIEGRGAGCEDDVGNRGI